MDYSFQRYNTMKQLKMSHEEVKREHKDSDGDPHIKQKRRQLQQEVQSGSFAKNVQRSTAVVRNPPILQFACFIILTMRPCR